MKLKYFCTLQQNKTNKQKSLVLKSLKLKRAGLKPVDLLDINISSILKRRKK